MVYQNSNFYTSRRLSNGLSKRVYFYGLCQAPITRVNKQLRAETLPIFYEKHNFEWDLTFLWGRADDGDDDQEALRPFCDMIRAFEPSPSNKLHASNLRFLTHLFVSIDTNQGQYLAIEYVGFCMSSDAGKGWDMALETEGLDWDDEEAVRERYMEAVDSGQLAQEGYDAFNMEPVFCPPSDDAAYALIRPMCLVARYCPQLTGSVAAVVEPSVELCEKIEEDPDLSE